MDRRGQTSQYVYNALDRLIREIYADGSSVARIYDAQSRLVDVNDSVSGASTFTYDPVGRTTRATGPFGTVDYIYDSTHRVASRQVIGQPLVTYSYDPVDNLLQAATAQATVDFSYDARDQLFSITRSNGVTTTYQYDSAGRVTALTHANGATILNTQSYTYDTVGNRTAYVTDIAQPLITQPGTSVYDDDSRLLQSRATMYMYDWDDKNKTSCGSGGMFGGGPTGQGEKGPPHDPCTKIANSNGQENTVMDCCRKNANNGIWVPGANDCANAANDCLSAAGLVNPGPPLGRFGPPSGVRRPGNPKRNP